MKHACCKHGIGFALDNAFGKMLERTHAAARDHRDGDRASNGTRERQVKSLFGTVAIHARKQNLARAASCRLRSPLNGVDTRGIATARGKDFPLVGAGLSGRAHALGIDSAHHCLAAKRRSGPGNQIWIAHSSRVERHLVGARRNHLAHARKVAKTAAHRIGNGELLGRMRSHVDCRCTVIARGGDVQEHDLVGALTVIRRGKLDWITRVAQFHKVDALHNASALDVQTRNDALG